jgi:hypothetical protein
MPLDDIWARRAPALGALLEADATQRDPTRIDAGIRPLEDPCAGSLGVLRFGAIRSEPAEGRSVMDRVCLVLPILPEKTADARAFQEELDGPRKSEYAASERTIGIDKEVWFIASAPTGDQLVAYMESPDFNKSLGMFVQSRDDFDMWFKERLANVTGVDLNDPPPMTLPEVVSTYEA